MKKDADKNQIEKQFKILKNHYTIGAVTHILRQARRIADYVIFLYLGELVKTWTCRTI